MTCTAQSRFTTASRRIRLKSPNVRPGNQIRCFLERKASSKKLYDRYAFHVYLRFSMLRNLATLTLLAMAAQFSWAEERPTEPIRVGILHSLSGTMAISERSLVDAIEMAIDEINQRGGVLGRSIEAVIEDGASDPAIFARKAEKLIVKDQVVSVFGCWTSASRQSVLPVFEKHNHLLWYPVQYEGQESSSNVIYTGAAPNQQIIPAIDWCRREFGTRMFLVGSDYVFPRTANELIKLRLAEFSATPVGEEYQPLGSADFDAIVAKIRETKPDVVLNTINGGSNREFFRALKDAGIGHQQIPVMSFSIAEDELRYIGVDLTVGHYCSWNYFQSVDTPANRRFVRRFRDRYGSDRVTDDPIEAAYFQVHLFAQAVKAAESTNVDAIRQAALGLVFAAPGGLVRIDPRNQHTWKVSRIGRIQADGQFKIVWSSEDPLPPRPYMPETFLSEANRQGETMFTSISAMIDLEKTEAANEERKQLLAEMADVRGYLGNVRTKFQGAASKIRPSGRAEFERAWSEFERRWTELSAAKIAFNDVQREHFLLFVEAREAFAVNANSMFAALYSNGHTASEVNP
jgi:urea transport system substrate-binding protein